MMVMSSGMVMMVKKLVIVMVMVRMVIVMVSVIVLVLVMVKVRMVVKKNLPGSGPFFTNIVHDQSTLSTVLQPSQNGQNEKDGHH